MRGKYGNDEWLGEGGLRTDSTPGEWPVSYHGTRPEVSSSIAQGGYDISKISPFVLHGEGIYSTPSLRLQGNMHRY